MSLIWTSLEYDKLSWMVLNAELVSHDHHTTVVLSRGSSSLLARQLETNCFQP